MSFEAEKREAMWMLQGLEDGARSIDDLRGPYEAADPALVHLIFAWLRARYTGHSAAEGVLGRIGALCQASPTVLRKRKEGSTDPIVQWFEESYGYRDLDRDDFVSLVVDKLEG
jgi:hypothetical protein